MEEIKKECEDIINEVCKTYSYNTKDTPDNKSLGTILKEIVPIMLENSSIEDRDLFYEMLRKTPIVTVDDKITDEELKELQNTYIGDINPHIKEEHADFFVYGKKKPAGAYVTYPIINEDMQIGGKKSYIYIKNLNNKKAIDYLKTTVHVPHLIHELGHAWHAEKNEYEMLDDNTMLERTGAIRYTYSFENNPDGTKTQKMVSSTGTLIEEAMNTINEEETFAKYLGISMEEVQKVYKTVFVPTGYQGNMTRFMYDLLEETSCGGELKQWRLHGDEKSLQNFNTLVKSTDYWKARENTEFGAKRRLFNSIIPEDVLKIHSKVFFMEGKDKSPIQIFDNVLEQQFNVTNSLQYIFDVSDPEQQKNLIKIFTQIRGEAYSFINSVKEAEKQNNFDNLTKQFETITKGEFNEITKETKEGFNPDKAKGEIEHE